jgi:hypothetical protein
MLAGAGSTLFFEIVNIRETLLRHAQAPQAAAKALELIHGGGQGAPGPSSLNGRCHDPAGGFGGGPVGLELALTLPRPVEVVLWRRNRFWRVG